MQDGRVVAGIVLRCLYRTEVRYSLLSWAHWPAGTGSSSLDLTVARICCLRVAEIAVGGVLGWRPWTAFGEAGRSARVDSNVVSLRKCVAVAGTPRSASSFAPGFLPAATVGTGVVVLEGWME